MSSRRTVILIAAVLIGAVAAYALYNYVNGIEDRANDNAKRVEGVRREEPSPRGHRVIRPLAKLVQAGADPAGVPSGDRHHRHRGDRWQGRARTNLAPTRWSSRHVRRSSHGLRDLLRALIPVDQVAVTVSVDQVHGVAGLLVPGDRVNLMVVSTSRPRRSPPASRISRSSEPEGTVDPNQTVRYLYQNVQVLAIGQTAAAGARRDRTPAATPANAGLITFNVPPDAAQRIALAGTDLYMTLGPKDFQPVDLPPVDCSNLFQPGVLTPYGPAGG